MKKLEDTFWNRYIALLFLIVLNTYYAFGQTAMINTQARNAKSLNGDCQVIIDPAGAGDYK